MNLEQHPFYKLITWFGIFLLSHVVAVLIWSFSIGDTAIAMNILQEGFKDVASYKNQLFNLQFITHLTTFLLVAIFFITYIEKENIHAYLGFPLAIKPLYVAITLLLLFGCQPIIMLLVEIFKNAPLPEQWLSAMQQSQAATDNTTKILLTFDSPFQFFLGLLMVGVFAGFGEEFTFRGIIQKLFFSWFNNIHFAIIVSAFIFAIFHGVNFNLLGIWFIGILLGYVYYYTGNLWLCILFHFLNNSIQVASLYLFQLGIIKEDYSSKTYSSIWLYIIGFIVTGCILYLFKKYRNALIENHPFYKPNNPL